MIDLLNAISGSKYVYFLEAYELVLAWRDGNVIFAYNFDGEAVDEYTLEEEFCIQDIPELVEEIVMAEYI